MTEWLNVSLIFTAGFAAGVIFMMALSKWRSGSADPAKAKQELEAYQSQVEAHFEETSRQFRTMANHYQSLYEHLAVGAVQLCRTDAAVELLDDPKAAASSSIEAEEVKEPGSSATDEDIESPDTAKS